MKQYIYENKCLGKYVVSTLCHKFLKIIMLKKFMCAAMVKWLSLIENGKISSEHKIVSNCSHRLCKVQFRWI